MKKMMFNDRYGLTEAALQGKKTVTRRLLKPTKPRSLANCLKGIKYTCMVDEDENNYEAPYYVGEIVAVAQSYENAGYREDKIFYRSVPEVGGYKKELAISQKGWNNKMFVFSNLMPHQIRILNVRAERLQDITDEDCGREGVVHAWSIDKFYFERKERDEGFYFYTLQEAFAALVDKISGKGTWDRNPYVWRIEFELVETNEK